MVDTGGQYAGQDLFSQGRRFHRGRAVFLRQNFRGGRMSGRNWLRGRGDHLGWQSETWSLSRPFALGWKDLCGDLSDIVRA